MKKIKLTTIALALMTGFGTCTARAYNEDHLTIIAQFAEVAEDGYVNLLQLLKQDGFLHQSHRNEVMREIQGSGVVLDFTGFDLSGADLSNLSFIGIHFKGVNFSGANLKNTCFAYSEFTNVNFEGADLQNADLRYTKSKDVNLSDAILDTVKVKGAELISARF